MRRESTRARLLAALAAVIFGVACASSRAAAQAAVEEEGEQLEHGLEEVYEKRWPLPGDTTKEEAAALKARWKGLGEELKWFERASLTPVTIDAGRGRGLKPGLLLRLVGEPEGQYLKVTRVLGSRSEGVVVRHVYDDKGEAYYDLEAGVGDRRWKPFPPVRVGIRVTSTPPMY